MNVIVLTPTLKMMLNRAGVPLGTSFEALFESGINDSIKGFLLEINTMFYRKINNKDLSVKLNDLKYRLPSWVKTEVEDWIKSEMSSCLMTGYQTDSVVEVEGNTVCIITDYCNLTKTSELEKLLDVAIGQATNIQGIDITKTQFFMDYLALKLILRKTNG